MITDNNSIKYKLEVLILKEIQRVSIQSQILRIFVPCVQWLTILNNLLDNSTVDGINLDSVNIKSSNSGLHNNGELKFEPYRELFAFFKISGLFTKVAQRTSIPPPFLVLFLCRHQSENMESMNIKGLILQNM